MKSLPCLACVILLVLCMPVGFAADTAELWLLSTREACNAASTDINSTFRYRRLTADNQWQSTAADEFFSTDATKPLVVFIHGNDTGSTEAVSKGQYVYDVIRCAIGEQPIRFVIWSWPAERVCRRRRPDLQLKLWRCNEESFRLACWLDRIDPATPICLIGHSFGPRIITGAMHLLGGGKLNGRKLPEETVAAWSSVGRRGVRAVLLAAAGDAGSLAPHGAHGCALKMLDRTLITQNPCDRVLRFYPRLYGRRGPPALGFVGPCGVEEYAEKLLVVDVRCTVGKQHDWRAYCTAENVRSHWWEFINP